MSAPLKWDESRVYNRGKVLDAEGLENTKKWGRYLDVDGDGICYRTIPGTHPEKGSFFTRGTSRDEYARYTEEADAYQRNMDRLVVKWNTAKKMVPAPQTYQETPAGTRGLLFFGTSSFAALEAMQLLEQQGFKLDAMRLRAFPFPDSVAAFIDQHEEVFVVEQNRDAQMRSLLINELEINPKKLIRVLHYDGMPISAEDIRAGVMNHIKKSVATPQSGVRKQTIDE
ncbi:MAG: hypothetical protein IT270_06320 [Saprospiraceae bacterium]|nr:hypothetical protein [Saprospiraceae bacterium]